MRLFPALLAGFLPGAALAVELPLPPGTVLSAEDVSALSEPPLPTGPWAGAPPPLAEARGATTRRVWRTVGESNTPDQLLEPIRAMFEAEGYTLLYTCADRACGGYDFRFALDLLPAPAMHVDLGDYRYLLAVQEADDSRRLVAVVTSRGFGSGYIHVTEVAPADAAAPAAETGPDATDDTAPDAGASTLPAPGLAQRLLADGHVPLNGLEFPSGSASLPGDEYPSLRDLAGFLNDTPGALIALVGHTDAVGALDANIRLSRARAASVRMRLIGTYGADGGRILAEGAGYLAPVASNLTPEGRAANRRVEAVLLSLE